MRIYLSTFLLNALGHGLMILTVFACVAAASVVAYALRAKRRALAAKVLMWLAVWGAAYFLILLAVSLRSDERVLAQGQLKEFCGFYLDCHMGVAVENVRLLKTVGEGAEQKTAQGVFYVVTLRVANDAVRAPLRLDAPEALVVDEGGKKFERAVEAERVWEATRGQAPPLEQEVAAGSSFTKDLVFDIPSDAANPRLLVTMGGAVERLVELFLVGDEDSLLHGRTTIRLAPRPERALKSGE